MLQLLTPARRTTPEIDLGDQPLLIADLTQSYAPKGGGGISTYLREKRNYILTRTPHSLVQIVPGPEDRVTVNGRHIFVEVAAPQVPGSPNYRLRRIVDASPLQSAVIGLAGVAVGGVTTLATTWLT